MTNSASEKRERRLRLTESETQTENTASPGVDHASEEPEKAMSDGKMLRQI
jgi:hypothetical protein